MGTVFFRIVRKSITFVRTTQLSVTAGERLDYMVSAHCVHWPVFLPRTGTHNKSLTIPFSIKTVIPGSGFLSNVRALPPTD
jgi:hypothetical protein